MIPNVKVFRPCDMIETAECWTLALQNSDGPSVLALSRQGLPQLRDSGEMLSARGAYRLKSAEHARQTVLMATGSEVQLAMECAKALEAEGIGADVVSIPSWELFAQQDAGYHADLLPAGVFKVSIEAGVTLGWERHVGQNGITIGIDSFGASAPAGDLFRHFGFTADAIVGKIKDHLDV